MALATNARQHSKSDFQRSNGLLRLSTVFLGVISIGLTASRFRASEFSELIYLATLIFCGFVSFIHFFLTYLIGFVHGGPCFKIADFIFHMTAGILLLVSSVLMLLVATTKGQLMDYNNYSRLQFQDTNQVLVRTIAGIFGLQNALLYFTLAYLSITNKHLVYCERNPKPKKVTVRDSEAGEGKEVTSDMVQEGSIEVTNSESLVAEDDLMARKKTSMRFFLDRFTWRRLLVDEVLEARLGTVLIGALNTGLMADSYQVGYETEEYFFSMVIVCLCLTFISQISYASGALRVSDSVSGLVDTVIQFFSCGNLLAGGVLMLGSVIQHNSYGYQHKSVERTSAAVLGIINGCLYCYIGANVKRTYFSRLTGRKEAVSYAVAIASGPCDISVEAKTTEPSLPVNNLKVAVTTETTKAAVQSQKRPSASSSTKGIISP